MNPPEPPKRSDTEFLTESVDTDSDSDYDDRTTSEIKRLHQRIQLLETELEQKRSKAVRPQPSRYQKLYRLHDDVRSNVQYYSSDDDTDSGSDSNTNYRNGRRKNRNFWRSPPGWNSNIFMDLPVAMYDEYGGASLQCTHRVENLEVFLASNPDISFVIFYDYNYDLEQSSSEPDLNTRKDCDPTPRARSIYPVSRELKKALRILSKKPGYQDILQEYWEGGSELSVLSLFIYHTRHEMSKIKEDLPSTTRTQFDILLEFMIKEFGDEYDTVDSLLQRKEILPQYVQYLIKPGDIVVENKNGEYTGYRAQSWPLEIRRRPSKKLEEHIYGISENEDESHHLPNVTRKLTLACFTWKFDGYFYGVYEQLKFEIPPNASSSSEDTHLQEARGGDTQVAQLKGQSIATLRVFPLCYAPDHIRKMLYHRTDILWKCRVQRLVSYKTDEPDPTGNGMEEHYMVDMKTYYRTEPGNKSLGHLYPYQPRIKYRHNKVDMARDDPPEDELKALMPPRVKGYNFLRKKWDDLKVDHISISDVRWRGEASQSLELNNEARSLLGMLVVNHSKTAKSNEPRVGKGKSLVVLLHGGPGTGKTHTAESISELAEKPLYRVTCSELGTKAEAVEKNLESTLRLGHLWDCVMLLEEADIFLEQRGLHDLERNALVSVFIRMVESYDGIVILECSHLSTLNDASRSRIQFALYYPPLDPYLRSSIWWRFLERLNRSNADSMISNTWEIAESLKHERLNGKQIRNIITITHRIMTWKNEPLTSEHIKDVIRVCGHSDTCLGKLHGGYTENEPEYDEWLS
ncbi:hypothetical protein TSTA_090480 [Talaromyces stipitatus ATCC 10500]|uniref:AAA+ ATPase domain-containing protein n=1 Tax=Talaromyces stipitatus (strain ATCC 10500 / CBS 375.48 / QM 6759 / NRRL 1006) TaxID=441959 RepID=B8M1B3_TALSN|nr:uncharacterized protein TSTA_090480 [Talaromyces stipitatus ATCC 10500]EED21809.1 hypothetical protein TSTA_090480 [Talaromyces stipitatus ATCC 10500]